jgi:hypothetical protein
MKVSWCRAWRGGKKGISAKTAQHGRCQATVRDKGRSSEEVSLRNSQGAAVKYRRDEWKLLQQERTLHRTPLAEAEAERAQQLHRDGVGPAEIAKQLVRTM